MKKIFINGISAKVGGGKSILSNYLKILSKDADSVFEYYVLTPNFALYEQYNSKKINIIEIDKLFKKSLVFPITFDIVIPKLLEKYKIDLIFNLADVPVRTNVLQIFLFDWSYAVYPKSEVWKMMDKKELFMKKFKLFYFKKNIKYIDLILAQTAVMEKRLVDIYGFKSINIVPNAVSLDNLKKSEEFDFNLPAGKKLLYLTHYYSHKNLEVLIPLAKIIKKLNKNYKLIITINGGQHANAKKMLQLIDYEDLSDVIINIGSVSMNNVPSLYKQCDALLMPTLLESFSGTYVEAMYHNMPIFTSDIDFAKGVCYDGAIYFDPHSASNIYTSIENYFNYPQFNSDILLKARDVLNRMPSWEEVFYLFNNNITNLIEKK